MANFKIGCFNFGFYYLQHVPASEDFDHP